MRTPIEILSAVAYRLRHKKAFGLTRELSSRQRLSREELLRHCDYSSRKLAIHAEAHVPYYSRLFASAGIDPKSMSFPDDWKALPILDKDTLRENYDQLVSSSAHALKAVRNHSGGSTGKPVSFLSDLKLYDNMNANINMVFSWAGWRQGEMCLFLWGGNGADPSGVNYLRARMAGRIILPVYSYDAKTFSSWWDIIVKARPAVIYAYPSVAADFAKWLAEKGYKPEGVKGVFCSAELLFPEHRKAIETAFGCRVYNQYGCREAPGIACECPEGNMHIFVDINRVEFIEQEDNPCGPKRIVVTPLGNYAQPLLRYDIGDLGMPLEGQCQCGRGYPIMEISLGRRNDHIISHDGRQIYPSFFIHLLDGHGWIRLFQFRQTTRNNVELLIEADAQDGLQGRLASLSTEIMPGFSSVMGNGVRLNIRNVPRLERTSAGKHRYVVNELDSKA